ncbi:MAG: hypothetical protein ACOCS6_03020 [Desulfosalsimonas sp.]
MFLKYLCISEPRLPRRGICRHCGKIDPRAMLYGLLFTPGASPHHLLIKQKTDVDHMIQGIKNQAQKTGNRMKSKQFAK